VNISQYLTGPVIREQLSASG